MFPGFPEHCNTEGTHSEYSQNIECWLGMYEKLLRFILSNCQTAFVIEQGSAMIY